jgi:glycolate oxidase iron-sulfur subunit
MKEYGHVLRDDAAYAERARAFSARVRDLSELLHEIDPRAARQPLRMRVAYQDACHLAHAQGIRKEPRHLLRDIPGVEVQEIAEPDLCCGSAGIYNLVEPGPARELGRRKTRHVVDSGAELLVTTNPGCLLQIQTNLEDAGSAIPVMHLAELLDASIRGLPVEVLRERR